MPIYEYETIPQNNNEKPQRFEIRQSMADEPLTQHPETGAPVKRVLAGFSVGASSGPSASSSGMPAMPSCGCGMGGACGLN